MAGGAGTVAAAGVVERNAEVQGYVEKGLLLAVIFVGQFAVLKRDGLAFGEEGYLDGVFAGGVFGGGCGALSLGRRCRLQLRNH